MRTRAATGFLAWLIGVTATGWALWALGGMAGLVVDWSDPYEWLMATEVEVAIAATLRLAGLCIVGWVLISSFAYGVAAAAGIDRSRLGWLSIGPIRRAADTLLAGYFVVAGVLPAGALVDQGAIPPPSPPATVTIAPSYVPVPAGSGSTIDRAPVDPFPSPSPPSDQGETTVVVEPGDHMWAISERHLRTVSESRPTPAQIDSYWRQVVEANASSIRSGDPDLIYPGERLVLPEISPEN